jgi:ribulose-bisphosphate carboxylase large chain
MARSPARPLSGERLTATYHLIGTPEQARERAEDISVEQTVEFPPDLISDPAIRTEVVGSVQSVDEIGPALHRAVVAFPVEVAGRELTQLMNVLFGNVSLIPGVRLVSVALPERVLKAYKGPRFGKRGIRDRVGVAGRPLLATAIKPMGLPVRALAEMAYQFALGGVDIIKDDHGLADQRFGGFEERVARVSRAVRRCLYAPNITAPADQVIRRARRAKAEGAGGLLIAPGLTGLDAVRCVADDDDTALAILSHPAMQGAFTVHQGAGISHGLLFGTLNRLAGADAAIFPNFGGRFTFTEAACRDLADRAGEPMGHIKPIFPVPAGGMSLDRVPEMRQFYGNEVILLIGGDLHRHGATPRESAQKFADALKQ